MITRGRLIASSIVSICLLLFGASLIELGFGNRNESSDESDQAHVREFYCTPGHNDLVVRRLPRIIKEFNLLPANVRTVVLAPGEAYSAEIAYMPLPGTYCWIGRIDQHLVFVEMQSVVRENLVRRTQHLALVRTIRVPVWFLAAAFSACGIFMAVTPLKFILRLRAARCWRCGYLLYALHSPCCPECGGPIRTSC